MVKTDNLCLCRRLECPGGGHECGGGNACTVPSTLTIQVGSDTGMLVLAATDNQTEQQSALTIDLEIS